MSFKTYRLVLLVTLSIFSLFIAHSSLAAQGQSVAPAVSVQTADIASRISIAPEDLLASRDFSLATTAAATDPLPAPHPEIAAAALNWATNTPVINSYNQIQFINENTPVKWQWHFTPNPELLKNVSNNLTKPSTFDKNTWGTLSLNQKYAIRDLAEAKTSVKIKDMTNPTDADWVALQKGYKAWPYNLHVAYYGIITGVSTCNIYVGDVLYSLGIDMLGTNRHYLGAGDVYMSLDKTSSVFVPIPADQVKPGDIVTWKTSPHIEIVTAVTRTDTGATFASVGGGRADIGQEKPGGDLNASDLRFFRVKDQLSTLKQAVCNQLPSVPGEFWNYYDNYPQLHPKYPLPIRYADVPPDVQVVSCINGNGVVRFVPTDDSLDGQYLKLLNYAFYYSVGPIDALTSGKHDWCYMSDNFVESGFFSGQPPNYPSQDDGSLYNIAPPKVTCGQYRPAGDPTFNPCATFVSAVYRAMGYSNSGPYSNTGKLLNLVQFYYSAPGYDLALQTQRTIQSVAEGSWPAGTYDSFGDYYIPFYPFIPARRYHLATVTPVHEGTDTSGVYTYPDLPTDLKPGDIVITVNPYGMVDGKVVTQSHISLVVGWGPDPYPNNVLQYEQSTTLSTTYQSGLIPYVMDRGSRHDVSDFYMESYRDRGPRPFVYDVARQWNGGALHEQYYKFWIADPGLQAAALSSSKDHLTVSASAGIAQLVVNQRRPGESSFTTTVLASPVGTLASATSPSDLWHEILNIVLNALTRYEYDQQTDSGKTTCYQAHTIDPEGNDSGYSNEVCLTNPPKSGYPYHIQNVTTIPITPSYKYVPALFDGVTSQWAIINYVAAEPVSVTLEFEDRTTLSGFAIGLGGDSNLFNAYSLSAAAANSLEELNAGSGVTQSIVSNVPTPALEHVNVSFPRNYTARFFRFTALRNEYSRHVHISELTPILVTDTVGSVISGTLFANSHDPEHALANAFVQACTVGGVCHIATTDNAGHYAVRGLQDGSYLVTAFPPANSTLLHERIGPLEISTDETLADQDLVLMAPTPLPAGTTITSRSTTTTGLPVVYWAEPLMLTTHGCPGGTATYSILQEGVTRKSGSLTEGEPSGTYIATIEPLTPMHGEARVEITLNCPDSTVTTTKFDMYIDPSGTVMTVDGAPILGATVTLYRSNSEQGPFEVVPDSSALMSPMNRANPSTTDIAGHFGWDVLAGYYKVRATKPGCVSPDNQAQLYVESDMLTIPPAVTDLDLRLSCPDSVPPTITATVAPQPNAGGWNNQAVTLTLSASDNAGGSGVREITYSASGAQPIASTTVTGASTTIVLTAEGQITLTYLATDLAGNSSPSQTLLVQIDQTAPTISITSPLSQAYTHTATLNVTWVASDTLSGVTAAAGLLDSAVVTNGQQIDLLTLALGTHTVVVTATDLAGNLAAQTTTFTVTADIHSLIDTVQQACHQGGIRHRGVCTALETTLRIAQRFIQRGQYLLAKQTLRAFNVELYALLRSKEIDQRTYALLKADALYVIDALPQEHHP